MTKELEKKLNLYLANQLVDYVKKHNLHWNLKGSHFFTLHAKLEELYDEAGDILDEVAERILALGGNPVSSMKEAMVPSQPMRLFTLSFPIPTIGLKIPKKSLNLLKKKEMALQLICSMAIPKNIKNWHGC